MLDTFASVRYNTVKETKTQKTRKETGVLQIKFFKVNGEYYARQRYNGIVVDTAHFLNVWEHVASYVKPLKFGGYDSCDFILDPTLDSDAAESILRDINIYYHDR